MRIAVPAIALLLLVAACGDGDSPFAFEPTPTVGSVSQSPIAQPTSTPAPSGCQPTDYTVAEGDTLLGIAIAHDTTVEAIIAASQLEDPDVLSIGQALKIPCAEATGSPTEATGDPTVTATPEATE
ncbi:MAG TPA: LysM peptidoglycan-binding domain-containing protein [Dehalococcoidia bacterium]|nr:LysM peptidoglycan-binding domain-containing protein [Dehalococcoidia bacterium]